MNIYLGHASSFDYQNELYKPIKASELNQQHHIEYPHDRDEIDSSKEQSQNVDLFVAEVSHPSTGLGIELGWADAAQVPILALHKTDAEPSSSIPALTDYILSYEDPREIPALIQGFIDQM